MPAGAAAGAAPAPAGGAVAPAGVALALVGEALATWLDVSPPPQPVIEIANSAAAQPVRETAFEAFDIIRS